MALTTTIYDASNAITTGTYYTYKGEHITVEYMGTCAECLNMVEALIGSDDDNEVVHVIVRPNVRCADPVHHSNPLFSAWANPWVTPTEKNFVF